ncbi:hypothetical protein COS31_00465 [Candidatus Roizmanbacteria bacterium CG02_land_8_20_14_3_00_36_15]|uniref:Uncharacterized protein n=2 Tax=Candidatus Roizmaniibacteriota TaxID=1752723 RepID=A0A2M8KJP7_9BACT|nr:MAG: hypothetical protein COS51_01095 [Candidatus Roizmanbacteria bacterium CG03_land_8_20_14_0_80_36_21]PIV38219.1 MAG: hypothetical protein COS31_00465 [Candidatus Roizmanbacteria bacterium CG02_land_8_20_14_3_00_36_15]PJA53713.1 MAG: hypothetical protein CO166_01030 [Candidatus Roizmanbacteria bacterium CG_4_9_14_3_um_filter_36_11]PJC81844.1 MAG: hypothetical protein CO007_02580 [Candidatus Roizmanbacteria bacterium CG_4_8_14_3_um_filter_36_10]PJE60147.1 MAG: hypothetical protein COU86_05
MKFCEEVPKEKIIETALNLINKSKKSINMTMDMSDEINSPLPKQYHKQLRFNLKRGIKINRYVYGSKKLIKKIKNLYPEIKIHFGGKIILYQRMLIIDKRLGIFSLNNKVFFTNFEPLVKSLLKYAKIYK